TGLSSSPRARSPRWRGGPGRARWSGRRVRPMAHPSRFRGVGSGAFRAAAPPGGTAAGRAQAVPPTGHTDAGPGRSGRERRRGGPDDAPRAPPVTSPEDHRGGDRRGLPEVRAPRSGGQGPDVIAGPWRDPPRPTDSPVPPESGSTARRKGGGDGGPTPTRTDAVPLRAAPSASRGGRVGARR